MIVEFNLRRESKLPPTQMVLQFVQERQDMLFQGLLAVLDVGRPLSNIVCCDCPFQIQQPQFLRYLAASS